MSIFKKMKEFVTGKKEEAIDSVSETTEKVKKEVKKKATKKEATP